MTTKDTTAVTAKDDTIAVTAADDEDKALAHTIGRRLIEHQNKLGVNVDKVVAAIEALQAIQTQLHQTRKHHHHVSTPVIQSWKGNGADQFELRAKRREAKMTEAAEMAEQAERVLRDALASAIGGRKQVDRLVDGYTRQATAILKSGKHASISGNAAGSVHAIGRVNDLVPQHTKESAPMLRKTHAELTEAAKVLDKLTHRMDNDSWNDPGSWWNDGDPNTTWETEHARDHDKPGHGKHPDDGGHKHPDDDGRHKHPDDDGGHHDQPGPVHIGKRVQFDGVTVNERTRDMIKAAEKMAGFDLPLSQGSYNAGGVAASAGTHDGGGAIDVSIDQLGEKQRWKAVEALRDVGFAAWYRNPSQGPWPYHIHAIAIGDTDLAPAAAGQVDDYRNGTDGLADGAPDNTPKQYRAHPTTWEKYEASR